MHYTQTCPYCGEIWWDSHACPAMIKNWQDRLWPTVSPSIPVDPNYDQPGIGRKDIQSTKPEQIPQLWTEDEIRAIIAEEIRKAFANYTPRSEMRF